MFQQSHHRHYTQIFLFALIGLFGVVGQTWALSFAYVANFGANTVSAYTIAADTGVLTPVPGSPFAAGTNPISVTVSPNGAFAYVANMNSNDVSAYIIAAGTGVLTPVPGSPFAAGSFPNSVTVSPNGAFAYVANTSWANMTSDNISAYTIAAG
ncbi:MAG: beta-propeller fold lactonase family protein, partial [Proteobacteria bacterium]|nr:beta-propeller fold lactonase family protein [Pseudomonadota bacterium]